MVMKYYVLFIGLFFLSCSQTSYKSISNWDDLFHHVYDNYHNKKDTIYKLDDGGKMSMYIRAYMDSYFEYPKSIDELLHAFDRIESHNEMRQIYGLQYSLMEQYKSDLKIATGDSVIAIFYKKIDTSNVITATDAKPMFLESRISMAPNKYLYFDEEGYLVGSENLTQELIEKFKIISLNYCNDCWQKEPDGWYKLVIIEYMPSYGRLTNAFNKQPLHIEKVPFFKEIEEWMNMTCKEHSFSRMIIPSWIPKE